MMGSVATIILLALALALTGTGLLSELRHRRALQRWLASDRQGELPDGSGAWRDIFVAEEQLLKAQTREVAGISHRLERYFTAAQVLREGIILLDASYRIEWLNAAAAEHLGVNLERDRGIQIAQLVRKPVFHAYLQRYQAIGVSGDSGTSELAPAEGIQFDSGDAALTLAVQLLRFSAEGTLLVSRDITAVVRTEKMRSDFVANVSHELRTPATVISGFLEQLTDDPPPAPEDAQHFLHLMAEQSWRMNRLVADLLTLSRLESDKRPQTEDMVDVPALIVTLAAEGRALSGGRHVIDIGEVAPLRLRGSPDELRSAFSNLVSNAIRYTPDGGRITLEWLADSAGGACLSVSDTGIGIAAEHVPRLTERFYRVDRGRSAATGGTGLGLAIVKHALARHQGKLRISSALGAGSTFSACLPAERIEKSPSHQR